MHVDEFSAKSKAKRAKLWLSYISNTINKILDILTYELFKRYLLLTMWTIKTQLKH
jgi:hypothetical protein